MVNNRWLQVTGGVAFDLTDPAPDAITPYIIGTALSRQCRFLGHTLFWYSVAEHSSIVADEVKPENVPQVGEAELRLIALLHDASEAYLGDLPGPLKSHPLLAGYRQFEERIQRVIYRKFGCADDVVSACAAEVARADVAVLAWERDTVMAHAPRPWELPEPPAVRESIPALDPPDAAYLFTDRLYRFLDVLGRLD